MDAGMAFLSIIAIIAIVVVTGALIAFIGNMIINAFDFEKKEPRAKDNTMSYEEYKQSQQPKQLENVKTLKNEDEFDFEVINKAKAEEEKHLAEADSDDVFDIADDDDEIKQIEERLKAQNTKSDDDLDADLDDLLSEISNDVIEEEQENKLDATPVMSEQLAKYNIDDILAGADDDDLDAQDQDIDNDSDVDADDLATTAHDEAVADSSDDDDDNGSEEKIVDLVDEDESDVDDSDDKIDTDEVEVVPVVIPAYDDKKETIEDLKAQLAELNRQLEEARSNKTEVVSIATTEEECIARLALLEERLKNVKKDYKINLKEYKPLRKVTNDLEKYQTKLRRKETKVANMKVSLYGVNNYVDLDKEKAEKLSNELELLDGLRFSVQHCEEVIAANKDRFPVLEHTNQILEAQIADIEADIATTQATLDKLRGESGNGDNENA